ncbi:hypothetical protein RJ641_001298 [Dillenia turbinata]|uniref:SnoaL-like domain-containing protein n=1 Tax=Dillenia turbinata TaxID=194707 RepID=A0AAN8W896_9MAGN
MLVLSFSSLTQPMVTSVPFGGDRAPGQIKCCKPGRGLDSELMLFTKLCRVQVNKLKFPNQSYSIKGIQGYKIFEDRRLFPVVSAMFNTYPEMTPVSAAEAIKTFYTCINEKNLEQLGILISDYCHFDDSSFHSPFYGKKKVMHFLEQLIACMGPNLKFKLQHICEGEELTAGVDWHLEWKEYQIPFTRGSSFYECSMTGERIVIKKAQVITESPIKTGGLVLTLLKTVSFLFENFPKTAEERRTPSTVSHRCYHDLTTSRTMREPPEVPKQEWQRLTQGNYRVRLNYSLVSLVLK